MFGINFKIGTEYMKQEYTDMTCHEVKSLAGSEFANKPFVSSVCVFDEKGNTYLYLVKDANGKCIHREEAPSPA